ncbi:MAG: hypothetical protein A2928_02960 [Candidatus Taylorbacteria bacterium RIFCSPLOWO2_01_FULL_45_15b]|uniref:Cupin 2 conserved barrel domain-containing protein n=1 Tax=Candidatus Taylorbacteria bacterium RIFCSPLOWO2_01_FULL_45_15b TaxID=1802319 RepID=A0A1G2NE45_9BACT|nr:MAG: hypothetical protein A2928_02960 [Candidatus Taylorbacteria bacterium RIFCSPLOWO2_01_FULL_45_15b]
MLYPEQIKAFAARFPGKKIVFVPETDASEAIVKIAENSQDSWDVVLALISSTSLRVHYQAKELWFVVKGTMNLYIKEVGCVRCVPLDSGDSYTINPGISYWVNNGVGTAEALVITWSEPAA